MVAKKLRNSLLMAASFLLGAVAITLAATATFESPRLDSLFLAFLVVIASLFPFNLPSILGKNWGLTISVSHFLIFCALLYFDPAVFVLLSGLEALARALRSDWAVSGIGRFLHTALRQPAAALAAAVAFEAVRRISFPNSETGQLLLATASAGLAFGVFRELFALPARSLAVRTLWPRDLLINTGLTLACALLALAVYLAAGVEAFATLAVAVTLVGVIFYLHAIHKARVFELSSRLNESNELFGSTIESLALAIDARDQLSQGHLFRVRAISLQLARHCGIQNESDLEGLGIASLLHDIGKLATPEYILSKRGALTEAEMETMESHASIGADILASVPFPYPVIPFIRHHHEKWDGTGYPEQLSRQEIPLGARILAVADCYDSMRSDRPYRSSLSREATLAHISAEAGKSFDPEIVEKLIQHVDELDASAQEAMAAGNLVSSLGRRAAAVAPKEQTAGPNVFQDIAWTHQEVQAIHEITRSVGRLLTLSETLELLAERIKGLVPYSSCVVYLANSRERTLKALYANGKLADQLGELRIQLAQGITGWVAAKNQGLINVSPEADFIEGSEARKTFRSCLSVPMFHEDNSMAVITLYSEKNNAFHPRDLRLVTKMAQHATLAIRNAAIYESTRKHAYTDPLTGLPNLRYFKTFIEQELRKAARLQYPVTLIMMDLNRFKQINDELGHKAGDEVLIHVAQLLRSQMRASDSCIRYGGDEFIGIMPGANRAAARVIVKKIRSAAAENPVILSTGVKVPLGISIGVSTFPDDSRQLERLMTLADEEMYRNKVADRSPHSDPATRFRANG